MSFTEQLARLFGAPRCGGCGTRRGVTYTHSMTDEMWCAGCYPY